jgi:hypothetical protein
MRASAFFGGRSEGATGANQPDRRQVEAANGV